MNDRSSPNARSSWNHEPTVLPGKIFLFTFINLKNQILNRSCEIHSTYFTGPNLNLGHRGDPA